MYAIHTHTYATTRMYTMTFQLHSVNKSFIYMRDIMCVRIYTYICVYINIHVCTFRGYIMIYKHVANAYVNYAGKKIRKKTFVDIVTL